MKKPILIRGKVGKGSKRGKALGFPTVNIALHKNIKEGVYISTLKFDGRFYNSLTFVGAAKTFAEKNKKVESYILDFNKNIYGRWITVKLLKKIRGNIKFKSSGELKRQMQKDLQEAKKYQSKSK